MTERVVEYSGGPGYKRSMIFDAADPNKFTIKTSMDTSTIADTNKALEEVHDPRAVNKHLASVPMFIYEQSVKEGWDEADWKKWLNDPDNKVFRVWKGRV